MKDLGASARHLKYKRVILRRFIKTLAKLLPCVSFQISNHHAVASVYVSSEVGSWQAQEIVMV